MSARPHPASTPILLGAAGLLLLGAAPATASGRQLEHRCGYRTGAGSWQSVSYNGETSCGEAAVLVRRATATGRRRPRREHRTVGTPHGRWRCSTARSRQALGVLRASWRVHCRLGGPRRAAVRFFRVA